MGLSGNATPTQRSAYAAEQRAIAREEARERQGARRQLAEKIVMIAVDKIVADIVRPGPVPEERECYDMARELRDYSPDLIEIVIDQLNVNDGCE